MLQCPYCDCQIDDPNARFCVQCGTALPQNKNCSKCGTPISLSYRFCPKCGQSSITAPALSREYLNKIKIEQQQNNPDLYLDIRDSRTYRTVKIGDQEWFAENLRYHSAGAYLYGNSSTYLKPYGFLYTWEAAKEAVPNGFRLPTREDFAKLADYVKKTTGVEAGTALKSNTEHWRNSGLLGDKIPGLDLVNFNALPSGVKNSFNVFGYLGNYSYFWTADEKDSDKAYFRLLSYYSEKFTELSTNKLCAFSVRVVKDL